METLTRTNWQEALAIAVRLLPSRLGASVNWPIETEAVVTIAFEPEDRRCACEMRRIEVRYFESLREHGWPEELEAIYGAPAHYKSDWPIVSVRGDLLKPSVCYSSIRPRPRILPSSFARLPSPS